MLSARHGLVPLLSLLFTATPAARTSAHDKDGDTALHYASASGELKALRLLLQLGASPLAPNQYSWTPVAYSANATAEAYFKQLIAEHDRGRIAEQERQVAARNGVRLVSNSDDLLLPVGGAGVTGMRRRLESFGNDK